MVPTVASHLVHAIQVALAVQPEFVRMYVGNSDRYDSVCRDMPYLGRVGIVNRTAGVHHDADCRVAPGGGC